MPEWLGSVVDNSSMVSWETLMLRLIVALLMGLTIAAIYHSTRQQSGPAGTFPTTLVLLCILIAMVTQVIGDNVARAFSLVGALSIVRFRTVVRDTKDTAFVIFAVVVGMSVGAGQPAVAICGMVVTGFAAGLLRDRRRLLLEMDRENLLTLRLNWTQTLESTALEAVSKYASEIEPTSAATIKNGAAMELTFRIRLQPGAKPAELVADLNRIEGIQAVELHSHRTTI